MIHAVTLVLATPGYFLVEAHIIASSDHSLSNLHSYTNQSLKFIILFYIFIVTRVYESR